MDIGPLAIAAPAGRRLSQAASQRTTSIAETICMPMAAAPVSHQIRTHQKRNERDRCRTKPRQNQRKQPLSVSAKPIPLLQNSNERAKKPPAWTEVWDGIGQQKGRPFGRLIGRAGEPAGGP